jgi:hypothetical protein
MPLYLHSAYGFSIVEVVLYLDILLRRNGRKSLGGWYCGKIETKSVDAARKITIIGCALILMGLLGIIFFSRWRKRYVVYIHRGFGTFWISIAIEICKPYQVICSKDHL